MRFYFRSSLSPTFYNISDHLIKRGWRSVPYKSWAHVGEQHFDFNPQAAERLEFKHLLAELVTEGCPWVMPETYCLNDENQERVLENVAKKNPNPRAWILKPALLNNGQHIKLFNQLHQIESHFISPCRMGGEHVLQHYISNPHLLRGHKYSFRLFVILTNYDGVYLYPDGYLNVARYAYHQDLADRRVHLTNEHLDPQDGNVIQIPTQRFSLFTQLYPQMKQIVTSVVSALKNQVPAAFMLNNDRQLAIYGFDFMVDEAMRVWLLEANHGPCFPISDDHVLQQYLYDEFWEQVIDGFLCPIAMGSKPEPILYNRFERLEIS